MDGVFFFLGTLICLIAVAFGYMIGAANNRPAQLPQAKVIEDNYDQQEMKRADWWRDGPNDDDDSEH